MQDSIKSFYFASCFPADRERGCLLRHPVGISDIGNDNLKLLKTILTITGSDSTGGSGVQADIRTISALGGYAVSAVTSITVQNTLGIQAFHDLPADIVKGQIEAIINDVQPDTVKVGMIRTTETLVVVVDALLKYRPHHIIYDPVVTASNGDRLMADDVVRQIRQRLLPLCSIVILREGEAERLFDCTSLKGQGHGRVRSLILDDPMQHGLINSFSSALAVYLSQNEPMEQAIDHARKYVRTLVARKSDLSGRSSQLYNEFLEAVQKHYRTNRDVAFYADCLNVSPRYLSQVAHRISGKSPKNIIDHTLTEALACQLRTTQKTIQEIAYEHGFASQAQFSKFFRKQTGMAPSGWRKTSPGPSKGLPPSPSKASPPTPLRMERGVITDKD